MSSLKIDRYVKIQLSQYNIVVYFIRKNATINFPGEN